MDIRTSPTSPCGAQAGGGPSATGSSCPTRRSGGGPKKRPKSPSEGFGTNRRCSSRSIGPPGLVPGLAHGPRRAHRPIAAHGVSERGGKQRSSQWKFWPLRALSTSKAFGWVGALSRGAASDACGSTGKIGSVYRSADRRERTYPCRTTYIRGVHRSRPHGLLDGILACTLG